MTTMPKGMKVPHKAITMTESDLINAIALVLATQEHAALTVTQSRLIATEIVNEPFMAELKFALPR